jgi:hypothetical protein
MQCIGRKTSARLGGGAMGNVDHAGQKTLNITNNRYLLVLFYREIYSNHFFYEKKTLKYKILRGFVRNT